MLVYFVLNVVDTAKVFQRLILSTLDKDVFILFSFFVTGASHKLKKNCTDFNHICHAHCTFQCTLFFGSYLLKSWLFLEFSAMFYIVLSLTCGFFFLFFFFACDLCKLCFCPLVHRQSDGTVFCKRGSMRYLRHRQWADPWQLCFSGSWYNSPFWCWPSKAVGCGSLWKKLKVWFVMVNFTLESRWLCRWPP